MKTKILCAILTVALFPALFAFRSSALDVSAKSAVLIVADTGEVIYEKNAHERMPMASTTKIMTALVALENASTDLPFVIPTEATGIEGSSAYLRAGETLTVGELVLCLMLESANDAATAIAIAIGGNVKAFADMMNEKATALGLCDTHFDNPHGLDSPSHYTTASDLASLTAYALKNDDFRRIVSTANAKVNLHDGEGVRFLTNHNRLLRSYDGCIGVKTGFTKESGRCLVSAAERDGVTLIAVTLSAPDDWNDHRAMLDYGFDEYEAVVLAEAGEYSTALPIAAGVGACEIAVTNTERYSVIKRKSDCAKYETKLETHGLLFAGINKGDTVGEVVFYRDGERIGAIPLVSAETVAAQPKKKTILERIKAVFG